jgi:hypothetical protein
MQRLFFSKSGIHADRDNNIRKEGLPLEEKSQRSINNDSTVEIKKFKVVGN